MTRSNGNQQSGIPSTGKAEVPPSNPTPTTSLSIEIVPTDIPTGKPSDTPSSFPSDLPSTFPSISPTATPSIVPSDAPSETPTSRPTFQAIPANPVPSNPPPWYFNYDQTAGTIYGPKGWKNVDTSNTWLNQFGKNGWGPWKGIRDNKDEDLSQNLCAADASKQSPKDLVDLWNCTSTHEIRTECGVDPLSDDEAYQKLILPHKLSIVATGRPCINVLANGWGIDECQLNQPPMVDYPRYFIFMLIIPICITLISNTQESIL